jgi:hypothetical protein
MRDVIPTVAGLATSEARDVRATPTPSTTAQADKAKLSHLPEL